MKQIMRPFSASSIHALFDPSQHHQFPFFFFLCQFSFGDVHVAYSTYADEACGPSLIIRSAALFTNGDSGKHLEAPSI